MSGAASITSVTGVSTASVTGDPRGGVPVAVAVLEMPPASISSCVRTYDTRYVAVSPTRKFPAGDPRVALKKSGPLVTTSAVPSARVSPSSDTATEFSVTLPVLVTSISNRTVAPKVVCGSVIRLVASTLGLGAIVTGVGDDPVEPFAPLSDTSAACVPNGSTPVARAELLIPPVSISAWVS